VEFALVVPLFLFMLIVSMQMAMIGMQYYSLMRVTRETARWTAIRPDTIDSAVLTHAKSNPLTLDPTRYTSLVTNPSCTALNGSSKCDNRTSGSNLQVTITYNMSNLIFLPTTYHFGTLQATIPIGIPAYTVTVLIE